MRGLPVLLAGLLLVTAACGGADGEQGPDSNDGDDSSAETQTPTDETANGSGNYAVVSVGGKTFEVPPGALNICNSLDQVIFGSFAVDESGTVAQAGGSDAAVQINFVTPVRDWEAEGLQPPNIIVDDHGTGTRYIASVAAGSGSVDAWELTDGQGTGTATFVIQDLGGAEVGTESGTFEVVCK